MKKIVGLMGLAVLLTGCAGNMSPVGFGLVTDVKGPITATESTVATKTGVSCASNVLGLYASGDASILSAKQTAGIRKVATVDYSSNGFYPFYGKTCVMVTGE